MNGMLRQASSTGIFAISAVSVHLVASQSFGDNEGDDNDAHVHFNSNHDRATPLTRPITMLFPPLSVAHCEATGIQSYYTRARQSLPAAFREEEDCYPNLSRHGKHSVVKKYLTEEVYGELKDKKTSSGVTLDDMIRAATSLPMGADPPRGVGVYAGDADSYATFASFLDPIIEQHHRSRERRRGLQRHRTNLDPKFLATRQIDPEGQYVLFTRLRLARSLKGFRFAPCISRGERRAIEQLVKDCCNDLRTGEYKSVMEMSNAEHGDLVKRRVIFPDPDAYALSAGTHRDWPDGRGLYCDSWDTNKLPSVMLWCNTEDHIWIVSNLAGGNVQEVFSKLSSAAMALETSLQQRGYSFAEDRRLGFLNSSPTNIGNALQASVHVKLVRLGKQPGFDEFVKKLRLEARAEYHRSDRRYSGIFDIGNMETLGKSEVETINVMIEGVCRLIELEKRLEKGEEVDLTQQYA